MGHPKYIPGTAWRLVWSCVCKPYADVFVFQSDSAPARHVCDTVKHSIHQLFPIPIQIITNNNRTDNYRNQ